MQWLNKLPDYLRTHCYYIAILSDRVVCGRVNDGAATPGSFDEDRLLELRAFNTDGEFYQYRDCLKADFQIVREIDEHLGITAEHFDEVHYLDQTAQGVPCEEGYAFYTTGGGRYTLPVSARKVLVRSYLKEGLFGLRYYDDWRVVDFLDENDQSMGGTENGMV